MDRDGSDTKATTVPAAKPPQFSNKQVMAGLGALFSIAVVVGAVETALPSRQSNSKDAVSAGQPAAVAPTTPPSGRNDNILNFKPLKPQIPFDEFPPGDPSRMAQEAFNQGEIGKAYNLFFSHDRKHDGPKQKRFANVLDAAFKKWSHEDPSGPILTFASLCGKSASKCQNLKDH